MVGRARGASRTPPRDVPTIRRERTREDCRKRTTWAGGRRIPQDEARRWRPGGRANPVPGPLLPSSPLPPAAGSWTLRWLSRWGAGPPAPPSRGPPPSVCEVGPVRELFFFFLCLSSGRRGQRRSCALLNQVCRPPRAPAAGGARRPGRAGAVGCPPPPRLPPPAPAQPLRLHPSRHAPRPDTWQGSTTARAVLGGDQAVGVCRSGEGAAAGHPSNPSIPPAARRGSRLVARRATGR